jgi:hypothetical protein
MAAVATHDVAIAQLRIADLRVGDAFQRHRTVWERYHFLLGTAVDDHLSLRASCISNGSPVGGNGMGRAASSNVSDAEDDEWENCGNRRVTLKKMGWTSLELCAIAFLFWNLYYKIYRRSRE